MLTKAFLPSLFFTLTTLHSIGQTKWLPPVKDTIFGRAERLIIDEDLDNSPIGKLPPGWRMVSRHPQRTDSSKLTEINGHRALVLLQGNVSGFEPIISSRSYLGNAFTIEYDYYQDEKKCSTGCATSLVLRDSLKNRIEIMFWSFGRLDYRCASENGSPYERRVYTDFQTPMPNYESGVWRHIAVSYYNKRIRCYVDGIQVISTDAYIKPARFVIDGRAVFGIRNIKVAVNGPVAVVKKPEPEKPPLVATPKKPEPEKVAVIDTIKKPEPVTIPVAVFDKFETENKLTTYAIHFASSQAVITPESLPFINQMADWLKEHSSVKLEISGHTDSTGLVDSNKLLSLNRAKAVKTQLVSLGVPGERLTTKGFGSEKPIGDNKTEEGKALNRRVEFIKQD